jgi:hypothetical protein
MDLFNPTDTPKDIAISRAIDQAVDMLISGNIKEANRFFDMAEVFTKSPPEYFTQTPKETYAV